ncbi:hypothetical protein F5Y04DRAFT_288006 [Hypomontagnella monticulosa]|nr:hypothetical protein F5Y04DRAFT_288006 [Hypomontagnella monticulosa]
MWNSAMSDPEQQKVIEKRVRKDLKNRVLKNLTPAEKSQYDYLLKNLKPLSRKHPRRAESIIYGAEEVPWRILEIGKQVLDLIQTIQAGSEDRLHYKLGVLNRYIREIIGACAIEPGSMLDLLNPTDALQTCECLIYFHQRLEDVTAHCNRLINNGRSSATLSNHPSPTNDPDQYPGPVELLALLSRLIAYTLSEMMSHNLAPQAPVQPISGTRPEIRADQLNNGNAGRKADKPCERCSLNPDQCRVPIDVLVFGSFKCSLCILTKSNCSFGINNPGIEYTKEMMEIMRAELARKAANRRVVGEKAKQSGKGKRKRTD